MEIKNKNTNEVILTIDNLQSADLQYADLQYADLQYTNLRNANLRSADLRYADLRYADLQNANLQNANLQNANLRSADLQYADLWYADLWYADLQNANLQYTNLRYADLQNARNIIIGPQRNDGYLFYATKSENNDWYIKAGCRIFTIEEYKRHLMTYNDTHKAMITHAIIDYLEQQIKIYEEYNKE